MHSRKFLTMILSLIVLFVFSLHSFNFEAFGAGYFKDNPNVDYEIEEDEDDEDDEDYEDEDEDEDDELPSSRQTPSQTSNNGANYWKNRGIKPEQKSTDANKVIASYKLNATDNRILREKHKSAGNSSIGKREQSQRYSRIFTLYPYDYLAAYNVALLNFEMTRYSTALEWIDKSLAVYPDYIPAKRLKPKIDTKRV